MSTVQDRVKIGWVGAGFIGQVAHLANYAEIPEAELVALAELRPNLGAEVCQRYNIPRYYENHMALLEDPDIEAVVAVVRRHHTAQVGLDILNAGKHLFTEKPMAPTLDQAERLVAAAKAKDLCYSVGFMRRHDEGVQAVKQMLDELTESGELGPILHVRAYCFAGGDYCNIDGLVNTDEPRPVHQEWPIAPDWLPVEMHREYEHFVNVCSHDINLLRYLFKGPIGVRHFEWRRPAGNIVLLDFGDFPGILEFCDLDQNRWDEGVEIQFSKGRLKLEMPPAFLRNVPSQVELYRDDGKTAGQTIRPRHDYTWAFRREDEAFVRDVRNGTEPLASGEDSLEDMRLIEDIWRHL